MRTRIPVSKLIRTGLHGCALAVSLTLAIAAQANSTTDASRASINVSIAIPVTLSAGTSQFFEDAGQLSVTAVTTAGNVSTITLRGLANGTEASVQVSSKAIEGSAIAIGAVLDATVSATGTLLIASGKALMFVPNEMGKELLHYGVRYSHMGFAWRDHPKGKWLVVHELNDCGTASSDIYDEGLGNFFMDDLWKMQAVILIPDAASRQRLSTLLSSHRHLAFHDAHYNMVAYPFSTRYQNSNQWVLEVIAAAEAPEAAGASRAQAQRWLRLAGYQPTELKLDAITRLGARLTKANIAFDDHPGELRWADRIRTVSVDSVLRFIAVRDPAAIRIEVAGVPGMH